MNEDEQKLAHAYLESHPFLRDAVALLGVEALAGINNAVGAVRPASSMFISPAFDPTKIHEQEMP